MRIRKHEFCIERITQYTVAPDIKHLIFILKLISQSFLFKEHKTNEWYSKIKLN
jgi:hypothetical protein